MPATLLAIVLLSALSAPPDSLAPASAAAPDSLAAPAARDSVARPGAAADSIVVPPAPPDSSARTSAVAADSSAAARRGAAADSVRAARRVVRTFPAVEVRALLPDPGSAQVVHLLSGPALSSLPVDQLADAIALQPGVVVQAEELHVRGGRAGEAVTSLEGVSLSDPILRRAMKVPVLALARADLVSGVPEAAYGGGLAGVLDLHTVDPGPRPSAEARWQTDGGAATHYDQVSGRVSTPLHAFGLGVVAAGEGALDDTWLPSLRTPAKHGFGGLPLGWRAENRVLGFLKLAPVADPERVSAQVLVSREVHRPYDPQWSLDGWVYLTENMKDSPVFSPTPLPGSVRYRAADHLDVTDERRLAALVRVGSLRPGRRAGLSLGWTRTRSVTSLSGLPEPVEEVRRPNFGRPGIIPGFYVMWGDDPYYRESANDAFTLRGDARVETRKGATVAGGVGLTYEQVSMRETDWSVGWVRSFNWEGAPPQDSIRSYEAWAPGGFAYLQTRWLNGGMVLNAGLRGEYWTAGPQASKQTLPGSAAGFWSLGPRLGIAYPISTRDAFSLGYVRMTEAPARDVLYDRRTAIDDRQPLGNPGLEPATVISYEAALKHLFAPEWAMQTSVFYRDVFGQVGALDYQVPQGTINLRYVNADESHVVGFEWSLLHASARRRLEAHYTWMDARGNESRPGGDPYGAVRAATQPPTADTPLSWDRRHSIALAGVWRTPRRVTVAWSTAIGSPLPWTPKPRRTDFTDLGSVNGARLDWSEATNLDLSWAPPRAMGVTLGVQVRNLFDHRSDLAATVDGYPNPIINTRYDDYGAYRTETGLGGGAYWSQLFSETDHWVPVHDPRLLSPPRAVRMSVSRSW